MIGSQEVSAERQDIGTQQRIETAVAMGEAAPTYRGRF